MFTCKAYCPLNWETDRMSKEYVICSGTMLEGFDVDILKYAGLGSLTDEQYDAFHDEMNDVDLLNFCSNYHLNPHDDEDVASIEDQDFFYLATYNEAAFKAELRLKICEILNITAENGAT